MTSEPALINEILLAASRIPGVRLWRQNSGLFLTPNGRAVRAGIPGCADISGIVQCERGCGHRLEIECKTGRLKQSEQQLHFAAMVTRHGGVYILARTVDDAVTGIEQAQQHA